jgi:hypothetical protein
MALRAIWQFMDRDVTLNILYGPYTILWVTDRSINCHLARSAMDYILHSIHVNLSNDVFFINCISKTKNEFGQNPEENIILIGPGQYTKILTGWANKDKYWSGSSSRQEAILANCLI